MIKRGTRVKIPDSPATVKVRKPAVTAKLLFFTRMREHHYRLLLYVKRLAALFVLSGGFNFSAYSGETVPEDIGTTLRDSVGTRDIDEFVFTERRIPVKATPIMPLQTVTAAEISELGIQSVADAVRRFAGTNVRDYGGIGGLKTVSVRNMGASHTVVSYDGVPVSNCQAGQIDIGRFSLDNVGMISLSVGQSPDMLQSARLYASAAVLGIETRKPEFASGKRTSFLAKAGVGSFGYISPDVRLWQKIGQRLTATLDATFMHADGNYPFRLQNGDETIREKRENSEINSWHAEANLNYEIPNSGELNLKGYYFYSKRGLPGAVILYNPVSTEKLYDENAFVQIRFRKRFSDKWRFQAQGKYNYGWNKDYETNPQFSGGVYEAVHRQHEYYLSATALFQPVKEISIALAQDGFINSLRSTMYDCPDPTRYSSVTALSAKWERQRFNLTGTLTGTLVTENVRKGERPSDIRKLNPTVGINVKVTEKLPLYLRAMYKSTFRVPSFNDLYYDRLGNRKLQPEKGNEYNVGVTWSGSAFNVMDYLAITADAYYNDVKDKIVAFPTTYAWRMTNYGKVRVTGVDFTVATAFSLPNDFKLVVNGAYTWQKAIDVTNPDSRNYKSQIPYTPVNSGNFSILVENPWVDVAYTLVGVGKRYYMAENIPTNEIDGYVEQNLTFTRELSLGECGLNLSAEITNLFNRQYEIIKFYPMPGRAWRITATFRI